MSQLPHVNATIVPFQVAPGLPDAPQQVAAALRQRPPDGESTPVPEGKAAPGPILPDVEPISQLQWRTRAKVAGRVKSIRVQPLGDVPALECVLVDDSGEAITLVFLGRRSIAGLQSGAILVAEGMVGKHRRKLAMINPAYELRSPSRPAGHT